jgi:hypothetical protein
MLGEATTRLNSLERVMPGWTSLAMSIVTYTLFKALRITQLISGSRISMHFADVGRRKLHLGPRT